MLLIFIFGNERSLRRKHSRALLALGRQNSESNPPVTSLKHGSSDTEKGEALAPILRLDFRQVSREVRQASKLGMSLGNEEGFGQLRQSMLLCTMGSIDEDISI